MVERKREKIINYGYNEKISFRYNDIRDIVSCMESFFYLGGRKGESQWNIQEAAKSNITDRLDYQVQPKTILFRRAEQTYQHLHPIHSCDGKRQAWRVERERHGTDKDIIADRDSELSFGYME